MTETEGFLPNNVTLSSEKRHFLCVIPNNSFIILFLSRLQGKQMTLQSSSLSRCMTHVFMKKREKVKNGGHHMRTGEEEDSHSHQEGDGV